MGFLAARVREKSGIWTNSIRGEKEFLNIVFKNIPPENTFAASGFCNDLYCPFCYSWVDLLKNGLGMDTLNKPAAYVNKDGKDYRITNYEKYMVLYNTNIESVKKHNSSCMGKEALDVIKFVNIAGCRSLKHNLGIIAHGYASEYGESEYIPIYDWIKANKNKIPKEMIKEFKVEA
jgi:hypothetical protein